MLNVFLSLSPFVAMTFFGYVFGYFKVFNQQNARPLNLFLFYLAIPALIIKIVTESNVGTIAYSQLISYLFMQVICGSSTFILTRYFFGKNTSEAIIWALTVALSNHVLLILPISKIFFGSDIVFQVSSIIVMDCLILISIITFCLELVSKGKFVLGPFMRRIFVNPLIISIFLSVFLKFFNFNLGDGPVNYFLTKLADCTMPVGLLALGIILSQVSGNIFSKLTVSVTVLKLVLSPFLLFLFGLAISTQAFPELKGALLVSVGPCGAMALAFCAAYEVDPNDVIKAIFVSTALSFFSIMTAILIF